MADTKTENCRTEDNLRGGLCDTAQVVGSQYGIIKRILSFLPVHYIKQAQKVCSQWENVGSIVLKQRNNCAPTSFYWERRSKSPLGDYYSEIREFNEFSSNYCRGLMFEPGLIVAIFFFGDCPDLKWLVKDNLRVMFSEAVIIGSCIQGIVGTNFVWPKGELIIQEQENLRNFKFCVTMLFVPSWPGLSVSSFRCLAAKDFDISSFTIPEKVRATIMLTVDMDSPEVEKIIEATFQKNPAISLGGSVGDFCWVTHPKHQSWGDNSIFEVNLAGLFLSGDNIVSASALIPRQVKTEKGVEKKLAELRCAVRGKHSFAFMFACCGRGRARYNGKRNVESGVFTKLYPETPLVGMFGNGEIGKDSSTTESTLVKKDCFHSFCTVFIVVSRK